MSNGTGRGEYFSSKGSDPEIKMRAGVSSFRVTERFGAIGAESASQALNESRTWRSVNAALCSANSRISPDHPPYKATKRNKTKLKKRHPVIGQLGIERVADLALS